MGRQKDDPEILDKSVVAHQFQNFWVIWQRVFRGYELLSQVHVLESQAESQKFLSWLWCQNGMLEEQSPVHTHALQILINYKEKKKPLSLLASVFSMKSDPKSSEAV